MPAVHLNHLVRSLRHAVSPQRWEATSDAELLDRYHADHDPAAFEAIVRRHGARIHAVCRKVLADSADVEDVFQATFLVLLRQGASIRQPESLGSWLCGVAHRLALQARSRSARRARAESGKPPPPLDEPTDLSWREACSILHEELDRLPETYRLPLLLCYLEGRSRDEAAGLLGCSIGALHGRLERGRERLRQRLTRRGITLSAGLFSALAANSATAGGLSEHLIQAALALVTVAPVPATVVSLAKGVPAPFTLGKSKLLAAVLLAVGVISGSVGLSMSAVSLPLTPTPEARTADRPEAAKPAKEPDQPDPVPTIELQGRVVGPDDQSVPDARITVVPRCGRSDGFEPIPASAVIGEDGRFRFSVPRSKVLMAKYDFPVPTLVATAPGFFPGWGGDWGDKEPTIRLVKEDVKVIGRVVNLEGSPVAGATVRVTAALTSPSGNLDPFLAALKTRAKEAAYQLEQEFLPLEIPTDVLPGVTITAKTDAAGRFELSGYGRDRVLKAVVEGPTIASREVRFVTREMPTVQARTLDVEGVNGATPYYGTGGTHAAAPTRLITGVVKDKATGKPIAGVVIKSYCMASSPRMGEQYLAQTTTDAAGRFSLVGMPKGAGNTVVAIPDEKQPYPPLYHQIPDPPGFAPVAVEIGLVGGVWIEGAVTDRRTGKPIRMAEVEYYPDLFENATVKKILDLDERYAGRARYWPGLTGADGRFRILGLPGKGYLLARVNSNAYLGATERPVGEGGMKQDDLPTLPHTVGTRNYNAAYEIDLPADGKTFRRPMTLDPGLRIMATLVGPDGKSVVGAESFGRSGWAQWRKETEPGRCRIDAYNPDQPRPVLFRHAEKNLVGALTLPKDFAAQTCTVRLEPGVVVEGRIVDADGRPQAGVNFGVSFRRKTDGPWAPYTPGTEHLTTDAAGRFRVQGLARGFTYSVLLNGRYEPSFTIEPAAGATRDLGDIRLDLKKK